MKKIKIVVTGALGKMGKILTNKILASKSFSLLDVTDQNYGKTKNNLITKKNSYDVFKKTDIIIDFSSPKNTIEILKFAKKLNKKIVIGTTGFSRKQENLIRNYAKKIAIFKSGNMSLGINLLEYITEILSKKIPNNYQIGIVDNHHKEKIDYPSGTALMLGNAVVRGKSKKLENLKGKIFVNRKGKLQINKINFFITRKGKTIGKHSVTYNN